MSAASTTEKDARVWLWVPFVALAYLWALFFIENAHVWLVVDDYQYGWAAPALFLVFVFQRSRRLPPTPPPSRGLRALAVAVCSASALLVCPVRLMLESNPDWRPLLWLLACVVVLFSLAMAYWRGGWTWVRHFAFPVLFPLTAVPWPGHIEIPLTLSLMKLATAAVSKFLTTFGIVAIQQGTVLQTAKGYVGIDEACSGIKSFQAMALIGFVFSEFSGASGIARIKPVLLGWSIAFLSNLLRIAFLVVMVALNGTPALERWHDRAGTTAFIVAGFLSVFFGLRPKPEAPPVPRARLPGFPTFPAVFVPCLILFLGAEILTFWWYRQPGYAPRPGWTVAWTALGESATPVPIASRVMDALECDAGSSKAWRTNDGGLWIGYFFEWRPGLRAFFARGRHSPEICLPSSGRKLTGDFGYRDFQAGGVHLLVKHLLFEGAGGPLNVFFIVDGSNLLSSDEALTAAGVPGRFRTVWRHSNRADRRSFELIAGGYDDPDLAWGRAATMLHRLVDNSSSAKPAENAGSEGTTLLNHP